MLSPDELGAYILVFANSIQNDNFRKELAVFLKQNKASLKRKLSDGTLRATQDDVEVFNRLESIGVEQISAWDKSQVGVWEILCNPFRALRPSRSSNKEIFNILQEFNADTFNFNKKFLQPEVLWEGEWLLSSDSVFQLRVLYNKFPFMPYHLIIVPDSQQQLPQFLTEKYHDMVWALVKKSDQNLPGFGVGYNSLGACASVNHLHFQGFVQESDLPIELDCWAHNEGETPYPMKCEAFADKKAAWRAISELHEKDAPYNILYRPGRSYLLSRKRQGDEQVVAAVSGAGWIEECGVFIIADNDAASQLSEHEIIENLKSLSAD